MVTCEGCVIVLHVSSPASIQVSNDVSTIPFDEDTEDTRPGPSPLCGKLYNASYVEDGVEDAIISLLHCMLTHLEK